MAGTKALLRGLGVEAEALYEWLSDRCILSERHIAEQTGMTKYDVRYAKRVLKQAGLIQIIELPNKGYRNPAHGILKVKPQRIAPISISRDSAAQVEKPLHGLAVWQVADRLDLIDCYLKSGWDVAPVRPGEKRPAQNRRRWHSEHLTREAKLDFFWENAAWDVGMWVSSNLTIFDFDSPGAIQTWEAETYVTLTCGTQRGAHLYFGPSVVTTTTKKIAPDVDTRCAGSFVVVPPSTGKTWVTVTAPTDVPASLTEAYHRRAPLSRRERPSEDAIIDCRRPPEVIQQGARNDILFRYGRSLRARGWTREVLAAELRQVNRERCSPPLAERELDNLISHVWTYRDAAGWSRSRG
jgi:hypothetical protein